MNLNRKLIHNEIEQQEQRNPQHQLEIISANIDLQQKFSPEKKINNPWIIQPWQNQQQNPSQSPQRRVYQPRQTPTKPKKVLKIKPVCQTPCNKPTAKVLESANNCNFSIRVRTQNRPSVNLMTRIQPQNDPHVNKLKGLTSRMITPKYSISQQNQFQEVLNSYKTPIPMIAYPLLMESRKRRRFRKIDKFQSYVSTSLRK